MRRIVSYYVVVYVMKNVFVDSALKLLFELRAQLEGKQRRRERGGNDAINKIVVSITSVIYKNQNVLFLFSQLIFSTNTFYVIDHCLPIDKHIHL